MAAPKVYTYNQFTRVLTGVSDAIASPMEQGIWLLPAFATFVVPPHVPTGKSAFWNGTAWDIIPLPVETVDEIVYGWMATDVEKDHILRALANHEMDEAAKALGFFSIQDAVVSAPTGTPQNQAERDAVALKAWRMQVISVINLVIAEVQGNFNPMPKIRDVVGSFPNLVRSFPAPPTKPDGIYEPITPAVLVPLPPVDTPVPPKPTSPHVTNTAPVPPLPAPPEV